jgi:hypothetical protein
VKIYDIEAQLAGLIACSQNHRDCKEKDHSYDEVSVYHVSSRNNYVGYNPLLIDSTKECNENDGKFLVLKSEK